MKKRGFSLAEVLVTMSIIGIAAALIVPAYLRFKPDRYKFRALNAYKLILETNQTLLDNKDIYFQDLNGTPSSFIPGTEIPHPSTQQGCIGLFCTSQPNNNETEFNDAKYSGNCKYPNLMVNMLNLTSVTECNNSASTRIASGTAPDTSLWTIEYLFTNNNGEIGYRISVDLNPKNTSAQSCSYSSSCTHPDTFTFFVDRNGDIDLNYPENQGGMDELTKTYIRNMENIYKEVDYSQVGG